MSLPVHYAKLKDVTLDDLKFQNLVDEARKRIRQYCPEWTEYNVSDPGVTLIELFAWMTELLAYRFNQVPYKHYIKFLEMLGYGLQPAQAATTDLTFRLAVPFPVDPIRPQSELWTKIERGFQVSTGQTTGEPIVFTVERPLEIRTPAIQWLCNPLDFARNYWRLTASGQLQDEFPVFRSGKPQHHDLFYIGFAEPDPLPNRSGVPMAPTADAASPSRLAGHVLRLTIRCKQAPPAKSTPGETEEDQPKQTAGHRLNQPPLLWEYCDADLSTTAHSNEAWKPIAIGQEGDDRDTTGGLYHATGTLTLFLPLDLRPHKLNGIAAVWVRCRYHQGLHSADNVYTQSPILEGIQVQTIGATTTASNLVILAKKAERAKQPEKQDWVSDAELAEELGTSNGEPGQCFKLKNFPILEPTIAENEEKIFVEKEPRSGCYEPWDYCETFAESDKHSKQVLLNRNTGEVHFGPTIRQPDGKIKQYGRVPPVGCRIFIKGYRYHAGANGNLPAGYLHVMHRSAPYVDSVKNRLPVENGRDAELVEEAILRAQRSLRSQDRAVSAVDFETLTPRTVTDYSQNLPKKVFIARVKCLTPDDFIGYAAATEQPPTVAAGTVDLLLVPEVKQPNQLASWFELELSPSVRESVRSHLQNYCLLARSARVRKPLYHAIKVTLVAKSYWSKDFGVERLLIDRIERFLYRYFSPLPYGFDSNEKEEKWVDDLPAVVRNERWAGWNFGEPLTELRLRSLLQELDGVKYVDKLEVQSADLQTLDLGKIKAENPGISPAEALKKQVKFQKLDFAKPTSADLLYCSFEHDVKIEW